MSVGSGFRIPLSQAGKGFEIPHVVDQTVRRELKKVDFTKNTNIEIHNVICKILEAVNAELIANNLSKGSESPAVHNRSRVSNKVVKAFENFKSQSQIKEN